MKRLPKEPSFIPVFKIPRIVIGRFLPAILLALFGSASAMGGETYEGSFKTFPQSGGGVEREYRLVIEIISISGDRVQARIASPDSRKCTREDEAGGHLVGNEISLRGKNPPELKGCGRPNFKGVRESDQLVGVTFFEGKEQAVTLRRR